MKVYISADIEGVAGICHWDDATVGKWAYDVFQEQMNREVVAACEGALAAGATHIVVKDAHDTGRNLSPFRLPEPVELIRGWSGHPYSMVQDLDSTYDALILIGYHSWAGSGANPLAHTYATEVSQVSLNGQPISEFHLMAMTAASLGVPTLLVAGDANLCQAVATYDPAIATVATTQGKGESSRTIHPQQVVQRIRMGVEEAFRHSEQVRPQPLPEQFAVEVTFKHPPRAYNRSFYPGARLLSDAVVRVDPLTWYDVMRDLHFLVIG